MWSSGRTPGVLPTTSRGASGPGRLTATESAAATSAGFALGAASGWVSRLEGGRSGAAVGPVVTPSADFAASGSSPLLATGWSILAPARFPVGRSSGSMSDRGIPGFLPRRPLVARTAASADSSLEPVDAASAGSSARRASIPASWLSSPWTSSTSSSTNRSTTRLRATASTSSRLSSTTVSPRGRPVARTRGPIGRAFELLAPMEARAVGATRGRLDRDGRALGCLPQAARETGPRHGAVGGVEVSILELGRANRGDRDEAGELVGEEIAVAGGLFAKAVLELDLDWSGSGG